MGPSDTRPRRLRRASAASDASTPARHRGRAALLLLGMALAVAGCSESRCRTLAARICEACREKAAARAGADGAPQVTMDMTACVERTAAACEAHQGPPGCPV